MPSIPLADAMIVWTPNTDLWRENHKAAPAGSIAVVEAPDDRGAFLRYPKSDCACNKDWQDGDTSYRIERLARLVGQLIEEEHLSPEHVGEAIRIIDMPEDEFAEALKKEQNRRREAKLAAPAD